MENVLAFAKLIGIFPGASACYKVQNGLEMFHGRVLVIQGKVQIRQARMGLDPVRVETDGMGITGNGLNRSNATQERKILDPNTFTGTIAQQIISFPKGEVAFRIVRVVVHGAAGCLNGQVQSPRRTLVQSIQQYSGLQWDQVKRGSRGACCSHLVG